MRTPCLLLLAAWLAANAVEASPPALKPVMLACREDAIRSPTNLVPVQLHTPPPLETTLRERAERTPLDSRDWGFHSPDSSDSTPISLPMADADGDKESRHLLDPDRDTDQTAEGAKSTAPKAGRDLGGKWGWLAGEVTHMEAADHDGDSQSKQSPWDALVSERDALDEDESKSDEDAAPRKAFDFSQSSAQPDGGRSAAFDAGLRDAWRTTEPGEPGSTGVKADSGFTGLSGPDDDR